MHRVQLPVGEGNFLFNFNLLASVILISVVPNINNFLHSQIIYYLFLENQSLILGCGTFLFTVNLL
jgi:hypothetical protein